MLYICQHTYEILIPIPKPFKRPEKPKIVSLIVIGIQPKICLGYWFSAQIQS